eukprot:3976325-Pleurochrysis_carterae.AAC.3
MRFHQSEAIFSLPGGQAATYLPAHTYSTPSYLPDDLFNLHRGPQLLSPSTHTSTRSHTLSFTHSIARPPTRHPQRLSQADLQPSP